MEDFVTVDRTVEAQKGCAYLCTGEEKYRDQ